MKFYFCTTTSATDLSSVCCSLFSSLVVLINVLVHVFFVDFHKPNPETENHAQHSPNPEEVRVGERLFN